MQEQQKEKKPKEWLIQLFSCKTQTCVGTRMIWHRKGTKGSQGKNILSKILFLSDLCSHLEDVYVIIYCLK